MMILRQAQDERSGLVTPIGELVAAEAMTWLGTPFLWQGRIKGLGCDCKGLLAGVAAALDLVEATSLEALAGDYGEGTFSPQRLKAGLQRLFDRVSGPPEVGDVLLVRVFGKAIHLAILAPTARQPWQAIEVMSRNPAQVVARRMDPARIDSVWRWRARDMAHG